MKKIQIHYEHELQILENKIKYKFNNIELLKQALTHRSFSSNNNEKLEFIGDSILNYSVAKILFESFKIASEGDLSRLRANLVNQDTLAEIAQEIKLGSYLRLGPGEIKTNGFNRPSILSDALEAIFAAISFDSNILVAENVIRQFFKNKIKQIDLKSDGKDAKSLLQEKLQSQHYQLPKYNLIKQTGDAHSQLFEIECEILELNISTKASAPSKRLAEQKAAEKALALL